VIGKMMASDDKTSPALKNGTALNKEAAAKKDEGQVKDKTTSDADLSKAEGGEKLPTHPQVIVGARAKTRFRKLIRITGTRFTRKRKRRSGNWINGTGMAVVRRASCLDRAPQLAAALIACVTVVERMCPAVPIHPNNVHEGSIFAW
jgi:hypothetical protein